MNNEKDTTTGKIVTLPAGHTDVEVARLAKISAVEYDRVRKQTAKKLGVSVTALDRAVKDVKRAQPRAESLGGREIRFEHIEPWPDPVSTTELLDELGKIIGRHVVLSDAEITATALWVAFTYVHQQALVSPLLAIQSPDMRCGKTTLLRLLNGLVARPLATSNITAASLFRVVEQYEPTLLIDEGDSFLKDTEAMRGILNSGHTRGTAYVIRTVGENYEPRWFSTWCPKAIAFIGNLPRTLADRAIVIHMRRKRPQDTIDKLPPDVAPLFADVRRRAKRWSMDTKLNPAPHYPTGLHDRAADNWSALFAIADLARGDWIADLTGESWPERARAAAVDLTRAGDENEADNIQLLADLQTLFNERHAKRMLSSEIAEALTELEDGPWHDWNRGKPINVRQIARLLCLFEIRPKTLRIGDDRGKGYELSQFDDAFSRYLPPQP
jgi:putative DNA primase/helicase